MSFYFYTSQNKLSITDLILKHVSLELLWLTMTQVYTYCELEFLPVYVPTEEEKCNPKLFASNVRDVMAK